MYDVLKRVIDILLAGSALLFLSPLLIVVMIILRFTGEGLVFFRQERIGQGNKTFLIWKFVTMREDSPLTGTITAKDDSRILPFGRFLRNTKLNELPQLINVLKGDMSIVGPRPLTQEAFGLYSEELKPLIYQVRPGLSGIGSVVFRHEEDILAKSDKPRFQCYKEDILPVKGALELWYAQHKSLLTDIKIVILTVVVLLRSGSKLYSKWFKDLPIREEKNSIFCEEEQT
ncbi:MAG: sugar transferase [Planctomycetota bacterium]